MWAGLILIAGIDSELLITHGPEPVLLYNPDTYVIFLGAVVVCFEGIGLVLPLRESMEPDVQVSSSARDACVRLLSHLSCRSCPATALGVLLLSPALSIVVCSACRAVRSPLILLFRASYVGALYAVLTWVIAARTYCSQGRCDFVFLSRRQSETDVHFDRKVEFYI